MPRRPIRVHTALAGWGVLAVGGDGGGGCSSVSGSRHAVLPVGVPVCADTRTPHTGSPHATRRVPACSYVECATHTESELGARSGR